MNDKPNTGPWSCFEPRFLVLTGIVAAVMIASAFLARDLPRGSPARIAIALLQGAASAIVIVAMMRSLRRLDELQQKIHLEALALSFAGTGALATGYGFLINAGLPEIDWGALVWPVMVALWAIGLAIASRRYR